MKFACALVASAVAVPLTWDDCGDASTHGHVTDISPLEIPLGTTTTLTGKGTIDQDINSATFSFVAKVGPVPLLKGSGNVCEDNTIKLPLGAGSILVHAIDCPAPAGDVELKLDIEALASAQAMNGLVNIQLDVASDTGDKVLCAHLTTTSKDFESSDVADTDDLGFNLHYYAPKKAEGSLPLILFVTGFSGLAPTFAYSNFIQQLADKGYIVVGMDHVKMPNYPVQGRDFLNVMEWVKAGNLPAKLKTKNIEAVPDLERVAVMGQSAGNHVVGQGLAYSCSLAKAQVMIDPVDGFDPFGMVHKEDLITPGKKLNYTTPALLLDNELDPIANNRLFPACAPAKLGAPRWFDATAGPVFNVNASKYGHIDCLNDVIIGAGKLMCPTDKTTDKDAYRAHLASTVDLFLLGLFENKADNFDKLEDASTFPVDVTLRQDLKGMAHSDIVPGCTNDGAVVV